MNASLDIVIVNWNAGAHLRRALASIQVSARERFGLSRVIVVDNASSDGSADGLEFPQIPLEVVRNPANAGFAAACNQGARESRADYLLFLNPDVVLEPDTVSRAVRFLEQPGNAHIGICGVQLVGDDGEVARSCARFPSAGAMLARSAGLDRLLPSVFPSYRLDFVTHRRNGYVDHVMGAFFLVRRMVFESLGGFDERFFVYYEDLDFSCRAARAGWRSYYLAEARTRHTGCGSSDQVKAARMACSLFSRIRYARKHFSPAGAAAVLLGAALIEPAARLARAAARGSLAELGETAAGTWRLWRALLGSEESLRPGRPAPPSHFHARVSAEPVTLSGAPAREPRP